MVPFDQRQQIALNALPADRSAAHIADRNLVDFVEENDTVRLRVGQRDAGDVFLVQPFVGFLLDQLFPRGRHVQLPALQLRAAEPLHHLAQVDHLRAPARDFERHLRRRLHLDLDLRVVQMPGGEALAERLAGRFTGALAGQRVEQSGHRRGLRLVGDRRAAAFLFQADRLLDQVAGDLLDVATDIADFCELGRLDLHERRVGQLGQAAADLGLAAPRGADHQDILGCHLVAQIGAKLLPPPAIAERDRDRALRISLADDMFVQRCDDGFGGQRVVHDPTSGAASILSTVSRSLV